MPDASTATPAPFALWYRRNRREPWRVVATAASSAGCTDLIGQLGTSGDWLTLPAGSDPNRKPTR